MFFNVLHRFASCSTWFGGGETFNPTFKRIIYMVLLVSFLNGESKRAIELVVNRLAWVRFFWKVKPSKKSKKTNFKSLQTNGKIQENLGTPIGKPFEKKNVKHGKTVAHPTVISLKTGLSSSKRLNADVFQ